MPQRRPPHLATVPIDAAARDGRFKLVFAGERFSLVRWTEDRGWIFGNNHPLREQPDRYAPTLELAR